MKALTFALACYGDITEIAAIYRSLVGTPGCTWDFDYPSAETAKSDIDGNNLYVLKEDGRIIAAASFGGFNELDDLQWSVENPCELARIGVMPSMQKQGIGTAILQNIIDTAREKRYGGIRMLVSKTNPAALALYDKNGFERCGEVFRYGIDFYRYQLCFKAQSCDRR